MDKSNTRQIILEPTEKAVPPLKDKPIRMATGNKSMGEWRHINWRKLERRVFKLQKRIYRASARGDVKAVRRLQKTLMKSWSARCIAVRRVTQDNQGKKTAGVHSFCVRAITLNPRYALVLKFAHDKNYRWLVS